MPTGMMWTYQIDVSSSLDPDSTRRPCSRHSLPSAILLLQLATWLLLATNPKTNVAASSRAMLFVTGEGAQEAEVDLETAAKPLSAVVGAPASTSGCTSGDPVAVLGDISIWPWAISRAVFPDLQAKWIWWWNTSGVAAPASDHATFCKTFTAGSNVTATMVIVADNECGVELNGAEVDYVMGGFPDRPIFVRLPVMAGPNNLRLRCRNNDSWYSPAGLLMTVLDPVGNVLIRSDGTWTAYDVDKCVAITMPPSTLSCTYNFTTGNYSIGCRQGYEKYNAKRGTCKDANECLIFNDRSTVCVNMEGYYILQCAPGYDQLNDTTHKCLDINECSRADWLSVRCKNTPGGYVASCWKGYKDFNKDLMKCFDIDECDGVDLSVTCTNLPGSYQERCAAGYKSYDPKTRTCVPTNVINMTACDSTLGAGVAVLGPADMDPWRVRSWYPDMNAKWIWWWYRAYQSASSADHTTFCKVFTTTATTVAGLHIAADAVCDIFLNGVYVDRFVGGYTYDEMSVLRLETKPGPNKLQLRCRNSEAVNGRDGTGPNPAGLLVSIIDSSTWKVLARSDASWMATDVNPCGVDDPSVLCSLNYTTGKVSRTCAPGYEDYDRLTMSCRDIDECQDADPAGSTVCRNIPGSYEESCASNYYNYDPRTRTCQDVDECEYQASDDASVCVNEPGSWHRMCRPGYASDGDPMYNICRDVNECANPQISVTCINTPGSYKESCAPAYKNYNAATRSCTYSADSAEACKGGRHVSVQGSSNISPWKVTSFADRDAKWIWWWRGSYRRAPSADHATFCQTFNASKAANATLHLMADAECDVYFNGRLYQDSASGGWPASAIQLPLRLVPGYNSLQLRCYNNESFDGSPAGVLAAVLDSSTGKVLLRTDAAWKALEMDECTIADPTVTCSYNATSGTYTRTCVRGYTGYNATSMACSDIDECRTEAMPSSIKCVNTLGWRDRRCAPGYYMSYDPYEDDCYFGDCPPPDSEPDLYCLDIDECRHPDPSVACTNLPGTFLESCAPGFKNYDAKTRKCAPVFRGNESALDVISFCNASANVSVLGSLSMPPWDATNFPDSSAKWIWSRPNVDKGFAGPDEIAGFCKVFYAAADMEVALWMMADNRCDVFIKGVDTTTALANGWETETFQIPLQLKAGFGSLQLFCRNDAVREDRVAGVVASLLDSEGKVLLRTDSSWKSFDLGECIGADPSIVCTYDSTTGKVSRKCAPGYENYNDTTRTCTDINECLGADPSVVCANLPGSYNYVCAPGYTTFIAGGKCV